MTFSVSHLTFLSTGSDRVRNPSICFVKRSEVLFFVSTRLTDTRFSRIHCCMSCQPLYFNVFESAWSPVL